MDTLAQEKAKYEKVWELPAYATHSPGLRHIKDALQWMKPEQGASITDWGSGSGQASDRLHELGFNVRMVDIAANSYKGKNDIPLVIATLWDLPDMPPTDYGFCADVMEHLPPEHIDAAIEGIKARTTKAVYFQIALFHDTTFTNAGPLHLSVFPPEWWESKMKQYFDSVEHKSLAGAHFLAVCQ
jgi:hypothetical protein